MSSFELSIQEYSKYTRINRFVAEELYKYIEDTFYEKALEIYPKLGFFTKKLLLRAKEIFAVENNNEILLNTRKVLEDFDKLYFVYLDADKIQELGENLVLAEIHEIAEGDIIDGYTHSDGKTAALVALSGGSTEQARDVAMHAVAMNPKFANPSDVSTEEIEKEKTIYREQLLAEGKPEQIIEKIIIGKVQKFCAEQALTSQNFVKDPSQTVESFLGDAKLINFTRSAV